jgi:hypothetical protein
VPTSTQVVSSIGVPVRVALDGLSNLQSYGCGRAETPGGSTMPHIKNQVILRAWRQGGQSGRIHFIAVTADGNEQRLAVDEDDKLYAVLDSHLLAQGHTGPASEKSRKP